MNEKLDMLDIHTSPCDEGKGNAGNPMNGTIFRSRNLQGNESQVMQIKHIKISYLELVWDSKSTGNILTLV